MFVEEKLGRQYVEGRSIEFEVSYQESGPATPMFFVLSPGVDPLKDVEALGKKRGFTFDAMNFHNVSLGQVCVLYSIICTCCTMYNTVTVYVHICEYTVSGVFAVQLSILCACVGPRGGG